jgi:hypothetical protein
MYSAVGSVRKSDRRTFIHPAIRATLGVLSWCFIHFQFQVAKIAYRVMYVSLVLDFGVVRVGWGSLVV